MAPARAAPAARRRLRRLAPARRPAATMSKLLPVRPAGALPAVHQSPNASSEESILPDAAIVEPLPVIAAKGETVILHGDLVHGSLDNRSNRFRYALLCTYIRKGTPFRAGRSAKRKEIELHPA